MESNEPDFKLWVATEDDKLGRTYCWAVINPIIQTAFGDSLKECSFWLKKPVEERSSQMAESKMWVMSPMGGMMRDEGLEKAAFVTSFLEKWDCLGVPLTMEGFATLRPPVATSVYDMVKAQVYPSPLTSSFFQSWKDKQWQSEGQQPPEGQESGGANSIPPSENGG